MRVNVAGQMRSTLPAADDHPYRTGPWRPNHTEYDADDLDVIGAIPADRRPRRLAVEPGRAVVARAGWLLARVLHVRERGGPQVILDAGMTELLRPALYGAAHGIVALTAAGRALAPGARADLAPTRVEGPICESTDALGIHELPPLRRGDLVAIRDAGAYAASQSSRYNGRPRPPQVLLGADGTLVLSRPRGRLRSLL